jgi:hypothetical protein
VHQQDIEDELQFIELNYEFSDECPVELRNYMLKKNLVKYYDDTLMLTPQGELLIGYSKAELQDRYDESDNEVYSEYNEGEDNDEF